MPSLETIIATTETDAVNVMLGAIGEAPIADIDTATQGDVVTAIKILRQSITSVLSRGWSFNKLLQHRIAKDGNDKFPVPADLLGFEVTERNDQMGAYPEKLADGTFSSVPTLVDIEDIGSGFFLSRIYGTEDWGEADKHPQIFIDYWRYLDFGECPEAIRQLVTLRAARQFIGSTLGIGTEVKGFTKNDEVLASNYALRMHGQDVNANIFSNHLLGGIVARRSGSPPGFA